MDGILSDALSGKVVSGTILIPPEILKLEGAGLVEKVRLDTVPTPMSKGASSGRVNSAMALKAAVPVWDGSQQIGVVYGGAGRIAISAIRIKAPVAARTRAP
jgi:hypothetical protein